MRVTSGPNPLRSTPKWRLVLVALLAVLASTGAALNVAAEGTGGQTVTAEFKDLGPITPQATVKISGVIVGTTGQPTIDPDRHLAMLPMTLDQNALPLHTDATATVRQISLIGEKYIDLNPGSPSAPVMQPGQNLPVSQTSLANDYQNIVQTLSDPAAAGLSSVTRTFGEGINGRGENVQKILQELGPAFGDGNQLVQSLNRQNGILGQIVDQIQPITNGLAADGGRTLDRTVGSATNLLGTTAANEAQLRDTIAQLPSTLSAAQKTLDDLTGTAHAGEDTLSTLRPTADNLANISRELQKFTDSANPALKSANPLLDRANALLDEARPLATDLRLTGGPLYDTVHGAQPVVDSLKRHLGGPYGNGPDKICGDNGTFYSDADCRDPRIQGILGFIHNWSLVTDHGDALQHYFRVFAVLDDQALPGGGLGSSATSTASANPLARNTVLRGDSRPGGSATGLNPAQEQGALGSMMGGH